MSELLPRINELAKKKKTVGLTADESKEQQILRQEYLKRFRANFRKQIENISIVDEDGNETPVTSKRKKMMDASAVIPGLKKESEYTAEEKQHVSALSEALATELGNPKKPTGEAGTQMLHRMNESHAPLTDWALSLIDFDAQDTVLDIGCGGGAALHKISEKVIDGKLFGIDYSDVALKATKEYNIKDIEDGKLEVINASVSQMPFADNSFDKIISIESYFFWPDLEKDLAEVKRVLKPGGKLLLVSACYEHDDMPETIANNIKKYEMNCPGIDVFEKILQQVGYQAVTIHTKDGEEWIAAEAEKQI